MKKTATMHLTKKDVDTLLGGLGALAGLLDVDAEARKHYKTEYDVGIDDVELMRERIGQAWNKKANKL
jgi:hypothetical protein